MADAEKLNQGVLPPQELDREALEDLLTLPPLLAAVLITGRRQSNEAAANAAHEAVNGKGPRA